SDDDVGEVAVRVGAFDFDRLAYGELEGGCVRTARVGGAAGFRGVQSEGRFPVGQLDLFFRARADDVGENDDVATFRVYGFCPVFYLQEVQGKAGEAISGEHGLARFLRVLDGDGCPVRQRGDGDVPGAFAVQRFVLVDFGPFKGSVGLRD